MVNAMSHLIYHRGSLLAQAASLFARHILYYRQLWFWSYV